MCRILLALGIFVWMGHAYATPLSPPYDTPPFDTNAFGNSAFNLLGAFRRDGDPNEYRAFIGTNLTEGTRTPGKLVMDFAELFTDGPGSDFAILTNSQAWGEQAETALFEVFLGRDLVTSFTAALAPDQLFEFEFPGQDLIASRITVTNITPDPPGINDLATMTFDNAGVAYSTGVAAAVPEPGTSALLGAGLLGLGAMRRRRTA